MGHTAKPKSKKKTSTQPEHPHPKLDGHYDGKFTGYDVINGRYHPAPMHARKIMDIVDDKKTLDDMSDAFYAFMRRARSDNVRRQAEWWAAISKDWGIDLEKLTSRFEPSTGSVSFTPVQPPDKKREE